MFVYDIDMNMNYFYNQKECLKIICLRVVFILGGQ